MKNHVGPFSSYQVDTSLLIDIAGSWTETTDVNWKHFGEQCIRGPNNKIPANCGQIVKKYLEDQEINEGFQYTYKGKNEAKANRVRRKKKRLISWVSFPVESSSDTVKQFMEDKIRSGEIDIGESTVESTHKKSLINLLGNWLIMFFLFLGESILYSKFVLNFLISATNS